MEGLKHLIVADLRDTEGTEHRVPEPQQGSGTADSFFAGCCLMHDLIQSLQNFCEVGVTELIFRMG